MEVETQDEFGNTLLMLAAQTGSKRMCKIILRNGASLAAQNRRGQVCMQGCVRAAHMHGCVCLSMRVFVDARLDVN